MSAAIQKQVGRDVSKYWQLQATVDAFGRLRDVPLGYWPVVIRDKIRINAGGVQLNRRNGQPYALVRYSDDWSLTVSHETIEMLVDPSGNRVAAGDSVATDQGRVQCVVEPCDPSESARNLDILLTVSSFPTFTRPLSSIPS